MPRRRLAQWIDEKGEKMYGIRFQPFWISEGTYGYHSPDPEDEEKTIARKTSCTENW